MSVHQLLIDRGFKRCERHGHQRDYVLANYYKTLRDEEPIPHCISNEKPPLIGVSEMTSLGDGLRYEIGFCNEAPCGWVDCRVYSLTEDDVKERLDIILRSLVAAWRALFEVAK